MERVAEQEVNKADEVMQEQEEAKGSSREPSALAEVYQVLSQRAIEEAIRIGVEAGTAAAEKRLEEGKKELSKGRYGRRLHNTRLLLANYRNLKEHASGAVFNGRRAKESALDILDGLDNFEYEDAYYISSIKQSQQRTLIILTHIDEMLNLYRISCEQSGKEEEMRRYRILNAAYIDPEKKSPEEIARENHVEKRTYYSDLGKAIKPLSALIFGIDGIRLT